MDEKDPLTHAVIGAAIEVHREMGPGLLESVYQKCMEAELKLKDLVFLAQAHLPLIYKGLMLGDDFIMDLYFPNRLVIELKAVEKVLPVHEAQLITYLRLSKTRVGLILNFNVPVQINGVVRRVL